MRKYLLGFLFFALSSVAASTNSENINSFASDFYQKSLKDDNIFFSPYSLFNCLSTLYLGAQGDTEKEMAKALHIEKIGQENLPKFLSRLQVNLASSSFHSADAIWLKKDLSLLENYQKAIKHLSLEVSCLDFSDPISSSVAINSWVFEKTQHTIDHLLSPADISKKTEVILTNAIHFQSNWIKPFSKNSTTSAPFYRDEEKISLVQMMHQTSHFPYYEDANYKLLLLPMQQSNSSYVCFFLLPKNSFKELEENLNLQLLLSQIHEAQNTQVDVFIPKVTLQSKLDVKALLETLGIKKAFSPEADFSSLTENKNLSIDKILHEAFFSLDENGVTASAATAVTLMTSCASKKENP
ncbi:MAG: hypothetical protein JSS09_03120, partial [Verrucomicrobia bacterium]|nr:hypothetical protein [Verrucomicrobiota bacterium]